jgi:hypothetical protein
MGHILHDWNLMQKRMLVRKAYEAVPPPAVPASSTNRSSTTIGGETFSGCS